MSLKSAASGNTASKKAPAEASSVRHGEVDLVDDKDVSSFYGSAVSDSYRLKSELVAAHLTQIGMGR